jgi:Flp pilus assembly protein TadD
VASIEPPPAPVSAAQLIKQAQLALDSGKTQAAIQLATRASQQSPDNAEAWLTLGAAYDAAGNAAAAKNAYKSCLARAAAHPLVGECKALAQ